MSRFKHEGDLHTWENAISVTFGEHLCARVPSRIRTGESVAVKVPVQCSEISVAPRGFEQVTKGCAYLDDQPVGLLADWYLVLTQINFLLFFPGFRHLASDRMSCVLFCALSVEHKKSILKFT